MRAGLIFTFRLLLSRPDRAASEHGAAVRNPSADCAGNDFVLRLFAQIDERGAVTA